jgi:D-lyxose ketol-isomerase
MKRSQINALIKETISWLEERKIYLPPFAYWTPEDWAEKGHEYEGLLLFTIRNGNLTKPEYGKPYAEKMLVSQVDQISPNHFHWNKMEDIINRGGGTLMLQLWNSTPEGGLADTDVAVRIEGGLARFQPAAKYT